ncbi:hypothetical protein [Streptomyces atratus]|uniref:hypothetical protein n=1 Tax=Streptomyces atratus TaxID=1893 RepID=UPI003668B18D
MARILDTQLGGTGLATWTSPKGGYFVTFEVPDGCAKPRPPRDGPAVRRRLLALSSRRLDPGRVRPRTGVQERARRDTGSRTPSTPATFPPVRVMYGASGKSRSGPGSIQATDPERGSRGTVTRVRARHQ